jgi:hypothetical protein
MTFSADRLIRNEHGHPRGRCVFKSRFKYEQGMQEIPVAMCEFPKVFVSDPRGLVFYIDGMPYSVSKDINDVRLNKSNPTKVVLNNFSFVRIL